MYISTPELNSRTRAYDILQMNFFVHFARFYMAMRECLVPNKAHEAQEEIIADLHTCLEQLNERCIDIEDRMETCRQRLITHAKNSTRHGISHAEKIREKNIAKKQLLERKRLQSELEHLQKNSIIIQQQLDNIISSQLNMVVVDTMKHFNYNTTKMALPARTTEIEFLEDQLADRSREYSEFHEALNGVTNAYASLGSVGRVNTTCDETDEDIELWNEINQYVDNKTPEKTQYEKQLTEITETEAPTGEPITQMGMQIESNEETQTNTNDKKIILLTA
jgi:hypothetical protein